MSTKKCKEWFVKMPWGNVAVIAWGDPANPPILMVHGYMDTSATFIPLVEELPDDKYYVAFDFPGNGKSDPLPPGPMISHLHLVEAIIGVVKHMKWDHFIAFSHSLGCIITIFYNVLYPGKITQLVMADPGPAFAFAFYSACDESAWLVHYLFGFYSNYKKYLPGSLKLYTLDQAVNKLLISRDVSRAQAELLLSRMLVPAGNGLYKLSFDPRMKMLGSVFFSEETITMFARMNMPPILYFTSTERRHIHDEQENFIARVIRNTLETLPNVTEVKINGAHDAHVTHANEFVPHVVKFLSKSVPHRTVSAKL